jgi:peptide/nickel transport system substrate-binding protein
MTTVSSTSRQLTRAVTRRRERLPLAQRWSRRAFWVRLWFVLVSVACRRVDADSSGVHASAAGGGGAASGAAASPRPGGELVFAFDGAAITQFVLDPHKQAFAPHHRVMRSLVDSLVVALPGHRYGPWLARSWEAAPDGLSYTFKLRDDVRFHDGTRFDGRAVAFNLDRIKDPKNALAAFSDIGTYARTVVVDDFTVRVELTRPYAPLLANLSKTSLGMVSPAAVAKYGDEFSTHPVGTGPFVFESLKPATEIVLARNPDYRWPPEGAGHAGAAWLDRLVFKNVPEEATRVAVLLNGQAGAADLIPPQNLVGMQRSPDFTIIAGELLNQNYSLYLNVQREPWTDPRVREAFKLSLDLDAAVKTVLLGTQTRAWSPLSPSLLGYDPTLENSWKPDRARAGHMLDELGWQPGPDGVRSKEGKRLGIVFLDTQGNREKRLDLLTVLRRQLKETGFDLRIDSQPSGAYLQKSAAGDFDLLGGSLFAPDPDVLRRIHSPEFRASTSVSKVDDPELNQLLERGYLTLDSAERVKIYGQAQRIILDRAYAIPVYVLTYRIVARNGVQGIVVDQHGFPVFFDAWVRS